MPRAKRKNADRRTLTEIIRGDGAVTISAISSRGGGALGGNHFGGLTITFELTKADDERAAKAIATLMGRPFPPSVLVEMLERAAKAVSRG